jgi:hypothetical protein
MEYAVTALPPLSIGVDQYTYAPNKRGEAVTYRTMLGGLNANGIATTVLLAAP